MVKIVSALARPKENPAHASLKPIDRLGPKLFAVYKEAVRGGVYDPLTQRYIVPRHAWPVVHGALVAAGFAVRVDATTEAWLGHAKSDAENKSSLVVSRIVLLEERLCAEGKTLRQYQLEAIRWLATQRAAFLFDEMGLGKAQPISEPVLTPNGWKPIGELKVGDKVIGSHGKPIRVTAVFPQGRKKVYRVTLSDGTSTRTCKEHLWPVFTTNDRSRGVRFPRILSLGELIQIGTHNRPYIGRSEGNRHWYVPVVSAVHYAKKTYSLHPYVLGALIANGCFAKGGTVHSGPDEQREKMLPHLPLGVTFSNKISSRWDRRIIKDDSRYSENPMTRIVKRLGLELNESHERFIPAQYLMGSIEQRKALLRGLMDNDGCISKDGGVIEYNTVSPRLAHQVLELIRSLGGVAWYSTRATKFPYKGVMKKGRTDYRIRMMLRFCPFTVSWKKERYRPNIKYHPIRGIDSIKACGIEECVCISVDARNRLYVTKDYIPTHNTIQAICAIPENVPVIVDCPASLRLLWRDEIRKWRSDLTPCVVTNRSGFPSNSEAWIVSDGWITKTIQTQPWEYPLPSNLFLISDEAHRYKGRSARTEAMQFFCADIRTLQGSTIGLTGTPLMNRAMELYTLFLVFGAMRKAFGGWGEYKKLWNAKKGRFGETIWKEPKPELADRIRAVSLRRTRAQVLPELPAKTYQRIPSEAGARLSKRLDDLQDDIAEELEEYARAEGAELPTKLVQDTKLRVELAKAKQEDMLAWIERNSTEEDDSPLIVFSMHRGPVEECGKLKGWRIITGDVSVKNRHDIVSEFQGGKLRGVALTLQSGGTGLTLTAAHRMLFVDRAYTPPDNWQAEDRVCRMGQTQPVIISRLVTDHPLEIRLDEILEAKSAMIRAAMGE